MNLVFDFTIPEGGRNKLACAKNQWGKRVFINEKSEKAREVKEGERWECKIFVEKPNFILVNPVRLVKTKEQMDSSIASKLRNKGFVVKVQKNKNKKIL